MFAFGHIPSTRELCPGAHPDGPGLLSLSREVGPMPCPSLLLQDVGQGRTALPGRELPVGTLSGRRWPLNEGCLLLL